MASPHANLGIVEDKRQAQPAETEPKQKTSRGYEIPVPKRDDFFSNLEKVSKPAK